MEINGLPLHPLAVHAAVVLGPVAALAALAYVVPSWRDRVRAPMVVLALLAAVSVVGAYLSGSSFREANPFFSTPPSAITEQIDRHEDLGTLLLWTALAFAVVAGLNAWWHERRGALAVVARCVLAAGAVAVIVLTVITGEAGSRAVWDGFAG